MSAPVIPQKAQKGKVDPQEAGAGAAKNEPVIANDQVILATAGYDHSIRFWQAHTGVCLKTMNHTDSQINAMEISPDGQLLAACGYQHIRMFDVFGSNVNPVVNYEGVSKNVMDVGFQVEGRWMFTGGEDGTVKIWDLGMRNLACQRMYNAHAPVNSVRLHPNQQDLIIGDQNGEVHIWDLRTDVCHKYETQPEASVQSVDVDSTGKMMAAVTNKGTAHIWDLKKSTEVTPLDTSEIASQAEGAAAQKASSNHPFAEHKRKMDAHKRYCLKVKFSPDSKFLATSSADESCKIWRTDTFEQIAELKAANQRWVWDLAFSSDSQYVFTATSDNVARLWHLGSGEVKRKYIGHAKAITCLAFRDGQGDP